MRGALQVSPGRFILQQRLFLWKTPFLRLNAPRFGRNEGGSMKTLGAFELMSASRNLNMTMFKITMGLFKITRTLFKLTATFFKLTTV